MLSYACKRNNVLQSYHHFTYVESFWETIYYSDSVVAGKIRKEIGSWFRSGPCPAPPYDFKDVALAEVEAIPARRNLFSSTMESSFWMNYLICRSERTMQSWSDAFSLWKTRKVTDVSGENLGGVCLPLSVKILLLIARWILCPCGLLQSSGKIIYVSVADRTLSLCAVFDKVSGFRFSIESSVSTW